MKLAEMVSPTSQSPISLLDLCTGTGCIPLLLCHLWPKGSLRAYGVDISPDAIELAKDNADLCRVATGSKSSGRHNVFVPFVADIRDPAFMKSLHPPFDIVTSNPPYISRSEYQLLPPCVKDYEDPRALLGDPEGVPDQDGLSFYHIIARLIAHDGFLKTNGIVAVEIGAEQASAVQEIMQAEGHMQETRVWKDAWGKDRTVVARKRG
jgi:release factor glutamine methyltransferase